MPVCPAHQRNKSRPACLESKVKPKLVGWHPLCSGNIIFCFPSSRGAHKIAPRDGYRIHPHASSRIRRAFTFLLLMMLMMTRTFFASLWLFNIAACTAALNANKNSGFTTYNDRWRAFEVVTQGDQVGTYTFPGQLDGIGVSVAIGVAVCYFINMNIRILRISIAALLHTGVPP